MKQRKPVKLKFDQKKFIYLNPSKDFGNFLIN